MGSPTNPTIDRFGRPIAKVDYSPAGPAHDVSFLVRNASTPSSLYIERDDSLLLFAASSATSEVVTLNVRILRPDGRIVDNQFQIRPLSTRVVIQQSQALVEGFLLSMSAIASVATTRGQTFARCMIVRSGTGVGGAAQILFADYVTTFATSGYPNGRIVSPTEGQGLVSNVVVASPAAGADWSVTVPTNARWRLRSWFATLLTSATVVNRQLATLISAAGADSWYASAAINAVASTNNLVSAGGIAPYTAIQPNVIPIALPPDLLLSGNVTFGQTIGSASINLQVGDQWSNIRLLVEEWLDNV